jgi:hypothetical protein
MAGGVEEIVGTALLDDPSGVHDRNRIGQLDEE